MKLKIIIIKGNIPTEIINIIKLLFYLFDIQFDENLKKENLLYFFIKEFMDKSNINDLKDFASNYFSNHKDLNITKEKFDRINAIIIADKKILSSIEIGKICRDISYCTMLIKECNEFMNLKTLDEIPYYELKN